MADSSTHRSKDAISKNMSKIRCSGTGIEKILMRALWDLGMRYRKNRRDIPGTPDICFKKAKVAVFCDSEFWHGKNWHLLKNQLQKGPDPDYWIPKIHKNRARDREVNRELRGNGWIVLRFWGKDIKEHPEECARTIQAAVEFSLRR